MGWAMTKFWRQCSVRLCWRLVSSRWWAFTVCVTRLWLEG